MLKRSRRMPRPNKHNNLVDDNWGATEYADEYYEDDEGWQEPSKAVAKTVAEPNAEPKPKPKAEPKPTPKEEPKPKAGPIAKPPPPPPFEEEEPILEAVDDWEAAMDALETHMSAQEEKKVAQQKGEKK
jgi:hypothetical protein